MYDLASLVRSHFDPPIGDRVIRITVAGYLVLAATPFVYAATHARFYHHLREPSAALLYGGLLVALIRRRRWAWFILALFSAIVVISSVWELDSVPFLITNLLGLLLLLSPPIRYYVRPPVTGKTAIEVK
jgi:hypothetical protein